MKIVNEAHMKFLYKHEKHENLIFIKIMQTSRYMYVLSKLEVYIHILNINESIIKILHKKQMIQGYTCITNSFRQNYHIREAKHLKTCTK